MQEHMPLKSCLVLQLVGKLLCALVNKLATPDAAVRSKVLELLSLCSTRIKALRDAQLPLKALLDTFKAAQNRVVQSTALTYLAQALQRAPALERLKTARSRAHVAKRQQAGVVHVDMCFHNLGDVCDHAA